MKALVGAFNQEKALVGAFSVIVQPVVELMDRFTALENTQPHITGHQDIETRTWLLVTLHFPPLSLLPDLYRHIQYNIYAWK